MSILDPSLISVTGEGIARGIKGDDATFNVNATDIGGNITVSIDGKKVSLSSKNILILRHMRTVKAQNS